ncbi:MAG: hypothetical protein MJ103_00600 [Saccharofermentans sp.]|nr:hypothetical protein [Saccharofermentans sp.]
MDEEFYELLKTVLQENVNEIAKDDLSISEATKLTLEYDSKLQNLYKLLFAMKQKTEFGSDMRLYLDKLSQVVTDSSFENLHNLNERLTRLKVQEEVEQNQRLKGETEKESVKHKYRGLER